MLGGERGDGLREHRRGFAWQERGLGEGGTGRGEGQGRDSSDECSSLTATSMEGKL